MDSGDAKLIERAYARDHRRALTVGDPGIICDQGLHELSEYPSGKIDDDLDVVRLLIERLRPLLDRHAPRDQAVKPGFVGALPESQVTAFIERVTEKSLGQEVLRTIDPSEQIIRIVYEELVQLMGPVDHTIRFAKDRPTVIMLCGLQGSGKTTTAGKLALWLKKQGRHPPGSKSFSTPIEEIAELTTKMRSFLLRSTGKRKKPLRSGF